MTRSQYFRCCLIPFLMLFPILMSFGLALFVEKLFNLLGASVVAPVAALFTLIILSLYLCYKLLVVLIAEIRNNP
jgi:hypothetical protein